MQKIIKGFKDARAKFDEVQSQPSSAAGNQPHPHHLPRSQPAGPVEPVTSPGPVESTQLLGEVLSTNAELIRDLGFSGRIGRTYINSYGDVLTCGSGSREERERQTKPMITASNCGAFGTEDPCRVTDFALRGKHAQMFCPLWASDNPDEDERNFAWACGITNVIPMSEREDETRGVVYFLSNYRKGGVNRFQGAGVAEVNLVDGVPVARRTAKSWWSTKTDPRYGDKSALLARDGYTYVYGGASGGDDEQHTKFPDGMYVCRVPHGKEFSLEAYEYWDGKAFQKERVVPSEQSRIMGKGTTGGMVCWNEYLGKYLFINTSFNVIIGRTADRPEGPWSKHFTIKGVADRAYVYCPSQQYRYDPSGKTLVVTYTAAPNQIFALRIVFK